MQEVRFASFSDVSKWLDSLDPTGSIPVEGDFSAGKSLAHCAQSLSMQVDGYPKLKPAIIRNTVGKLAQLRFLRRGTLAHSTDDPIPGAPRVDDVTSANGIAMLRSAIENFENHQGDLPPHFMFGSVDKPTAERLQSMHIADHASNFRP